MFPYYISCIYFNLLFLLCCGAFQKDKMLIKIPKAGFLKTVDSKKSLSNEPSAGGLTDIWQQIVSVKVSNLANAYAAVTSPLVSVSVLDCLKQNHICIN